MPLHLPYPRSFLGLLLAGFSLVALPLVGALAYSAWTTERLADQSRSAVFNASQAARASRSLVNRIGSVPGGEGGHFRVTLPRKKTRALAVVAA